MTCGDVASYQNGILLLQFSTAIFLASLSGGVSLLSVKPKTQKREEEPESAQIVEIQEAPVVQEVPELPEVPRAETMRPRKTAANSRAITISFDNSRNSNFNL